ncbi:hypothetical protein ASPBRDRAFT_186336 [Aspergillus brasiliensis CBS 101740]|uniref:RING-type domain-containing protein n=1 Tax=Aspergillus brasiliensis (strain CBS 101740 / IMI 381727 / IBT 21946) TaxID=767769 RepID=A0A1L9U7Q3_ASPBC|nr:hypothetical protein ASPBRDRAFT_186336 [Aspergillus brasiliensis CBS 101740]
MTIPGKRNCTPQPAERGAKKLRHDLGNSEAIVRGNFIDLTLNDEDNNENAHVAGALEVTSSSTVNGSLIDQTSRPSLSYSPHIVDKGYDTCFGMLCMRATASDEGQLPVGCTPATLIFKRDVVRVMIGTEKRVAILVTKALWSLTTKFAVTLHATICGRRPKLAATKDKLSKRTNSLIATTKIKYYSLRVFIYGFSRQKKEIGDYLAGKELFLQHPHPSEIDSGVKYLNPQYLLPPGKEEMPPPSQLSIATCCAVRESPGTDALSEDIRARLYQIFDTASANRGIKLDIQPSTRLTTVLKRHQLEALIMMVEKETGIFEDSQFPSIWVPFRSPGGGIRYQNIVTKLFSMDRPAPVGGGILADDMGLGKTLSALALVCNSLDRHQESALTSVPKGTLIVTPKSTIYGWESQIKRHIHPEQIQWLTYHGYKRHELDKSLDKYDAVLTTYDTLNAEGEEGSLLNHEWQRIILDEAHRIRNSSSKTFRTVCSLQAQYRWCLTGTPIQNRLADFGALLEFIRVPPFESPGSFNRLIVDFISENKARSFDLLRSVVTATCLRRTKTSYAAELRLPRKTELVERVHMDKEDRELYEFFKRYSFLTAGKAVSSQKRAGTNILVLIHHLRLICNHGVALLPKAALIAWHERDDTSLTWRTLESETVKCAICAQSVEENRSSESLVEEVGCGHFLCESCTTENNSQPSCPKCEANQCRSSSPTPTSFTHPLAVGYAPSAKLRALLRNITQSRSISDKNGVQTKFVIFSYWTKMLDLIATALTENHLTFRRIDGQSSLSERKEALSVFNSDPQCNIMLASVGAAGEGIDLTAASSIHIVEPQWNPMAEAQAIDRVHRIGQERDVEVVRYITSESIESYVQWIQWDKLRLISKALSSAEQCAENVTEKWWKKMLQYLK